MVPKEITIEVASDKESGGGESGGSESGDGDSGGAGQTGQNSATEKLTRTYWSTEYGPVLDFPGLGWSATRVISFRDANIENTRFMEQYREMNMADSVDELIAADQKFQGIPFTNTIAADSAGNTWYADTSATPNLSAEAIAAYEKRLGEDPITMAAKESSAFLLSGATSRDDWVDDPDAPRPGVLPWSKLPMIERSDYVMNANDSYWVPNSEHLIEGDFSPLQGSAGTMRSVRTLQNLAVLDDTSETGAMGEDGLFNLEELSQASLSGGAYLADQWRDGVAEACATATGDVASAEIRETETDKVWAESTMVDIAPACSVLRDWDGEFNAASRGAVLWREFTSRLSGLPLWKTPFTASDPGRTPSGFGLAPGEEGISTTKGILAALATAVVTLEKYGFDLDSELGEVQFDARNPEDRIGLPGGLGSDGVTNVVSNGAATSFTMQEQPEVAEPKLKGTTITSDGYPVSYGTSFLFAVAFGDDGPRAKSLLAYGQVGDPESSLFTSQTRDFAAGRFKDVLFTEEDIRSDADLEEIRASG
jgi:acyl-homoserine-lactone acylase